MTRRNVTGFANTDRGPVLRWRCNCGHEGLLDGSGSTAEPRPQVAPRQYAALTS